MSEPGFTRIVVRVRGGVQGVGFREFTRRSAAACEIGGWVCNRPDGSVEAELEGSSTELDRLVALLSEGPRWARVEALEIVSKTDGGAQRALAFPLEIRR